MTISTCDVKREATR